jgi:hypothetical protein
LHYLHGTKHYMLTYKKTDNLEVISYLDANFVGCADSQKSSCHRCPTRFPLPELQPGGLNPTEPVVRRHTPCGCSAAVVLNPDRVCVSC